MRVTVLGCGSSQGVPTIGGHWGDCDPRNPRNRRRRPSIFVEWDGVNILVDTSPDLRDQALDAGIERLDAVLYTHAHADHVHGIDDLRGIARGTGADIDVYAEREVLDEIVTRFPYLFRGASGPGRNYPPFLRPHAIGGPIETHGLTIQPFEQDHGICRSTGFRFGAFAYSTDVVRLPEASLDTIAGVDTWLVDCLRLRRAHPTHAHWPVTSAWLDRVRPRRAILTHMNHHADYDAMRAATPDDVEPAYDGMSIEVP